MKRLILSGILLQVAQSQAFASKEPLFTGAALAGLIIANVILGGLFVFGVLILASVLLERRKFKKSLRESNATESHNSNLEVGLNRLGSNSK